MIIYGRNPVAEALCGPREVQRIWATERAARVDWLRARDVLTSEVGGLKELCGSAEHQGICAEVGPFLYEEADSLLADRNALVLCLDEVQDPHNLGAAARVAEAAGVAGVVLPERRAADVTPAVCKASAGAVEHLRIARVRNLADWLERSKAGGVWIYGADTGDAAIPYDRPDYGGRVVLVLGSEGRGLRPRVAATCDALIRLPQLGKVASLNIATAASALVYGVLLLRSASAPPGAPSSNRLPSGVDRASRRRDTRGR